MTASEPTIDSVCGMSGVLEDALTVDFLRRWFAEHCLDDAETAHNLPAGNDAGGVERETK